MTVTLPETLQYGKVVGRFVLAVGDEPTDVDFFPNAVPASGTISFTSALPLTKEMLATPPTTVVRSVIQATIDENGFLYNPKDPDGPRGIWLVTGVYKVAYNLNTGAIAGHDILVLPEHTAESPLDIINHMPPGGPVLTASQYAELSARIETKLPEIEWVGDRLSVDGVLSPALSGPADTTGVVQHESKTKGIHGINDTENILIGMPMNHTDIAFSLVDADGRRSWLEVANDGLPTPRVKDLLYDVVSEQTPEHPTTSQYAFSVTDPDGDIGELAIELSGNVPDWILKRWKTRMGVPESIFTPTYPKIELPSKLYALQGTQHQLVHKHYITGLGADDNVKAPNPNNGTQSTGEKWIITPTTPGSVDFTFEVYDKNIVKTASKTINVITNDSALSVPCRLLPIGDSISMNGTYAQTAASLLGGTTVGLREVNGIRNEGRGGWAFAYYTQNIGKLGWTWDSPFIFPVGVDPVRYRGNTDYWKSVVSVPGASAYETTGFQRAARANYETTGPFMFDANGYPNPATEGDVVVDPSLAVGSRWRQYVSGAWVTMNPQPSTALNFSGYLSRNAHAIPQPPTVISIMSATNDLTGSASGLTEESMAAAFSTYVIQLDIFIAAVRSWNATVPIILCIPPVGGFQSQTAWLTAGRHEFEYQHRVKMYSRSMIAKYDTDEQRANRVFLTTFLGSVSPSEMNGGVHPSNVGHATMGAWLAGTIANVLN